MPYTLNHEKLRFSSEAPLPSLDQLLQMYEANKSNGPTLDYSFGLPESVLYGDSPESEKLRERIRDILGEAQSEHPAINCFEDLGVDSNGEENMLFSHLTSDAFNAQVKSKVAEAAKELGFLN